MNGMFKFAMAASVIIVGSGAASVAEARPRCDGPFQQSAYGPISTPYCQELQIARVARAYGFNVSDGQVRYNDLTKINLCNALGHDVRLKESCIGLRSGRRG